MNKDEDCICFYRDAVIAGHDDPAAVTMRRFNLSRDYTVRLLNEAIARCDGQDIRSAVEDASRLGRLVIQRMPIQQYRPKTDMGPPACHSSASIQNNSGLRFMYGHSRSQKSGAGMVGECIGVAYVA